jgi:MoaA/NifB/PqqE/SkfB family radical SAM enzyme
MGKPEITISINPSYFCNFDCEFCYLSPDQLNDKTELSIDILKKQIGEVESFFTITCIDIYGGEVALLPEKYLRQIIDLFDSKVHINMISNFSKINPIFYDDRISISVSWESSIRRKSEQVLNNMKDFSRDINLLMLAGKEMLTWSEKDIKSISEMVSETKSIRTLEIKPYSSNQSNDFGISFLEFEGVVKSWMKFSGDYLFVNEENLAGVFAGTSNSFSDNHLYISPEGDLEVLDFDDDNREYFRKVDSVSDYWAWTNNEKLKVSNNSFCNQCDYMGTCLSEHLRHVESIEESCNGFVKLIDWFKQGGHNENV